MYEVFFVIVTIGASVFAYLGGKAAGLEKGRIQGASMYRQYIIDETRKIINSDKGKNDISE